MPSRRRTCGKPRNRGVKTVNKRQFAAALCCYAIVFIPLGILLAAAYLPDDQLAYILAVIDSAKG